MEQNIENERSDVSDIGGFQKDNFEEREVNFKIIYGLWDITFKKK